MNEVAYRDARRQTIEAVSIEMAAGGWVLEELRRLRGNQYLLVFRCLP